jgi:hypothetical protein
MKTYITASILLMSVNIFSQDFDKNAATAKSAYAAGKLEDSRFAMEQMLRELDVAIGKEILKLLPPKMGTMSLNAKDDNVSGGTGAAGLYVHRSYGATPKMTVLDIINNSPLMAGISAMLSMPMIGMGDPNQKQVKVQGYKAMLRKNENSESGKPEYELQVPFNNTLLTLKVDDSNESEILNFANQIPLAKIAQMAQ